jgi:hypothetical protein
VGIGGGEAERVREERLGATGERETAVRWGGKTSGKRRQFLSVVGMKISYGIYQDLKGTPAPHGQIASCNVKR